MSRYLIVSSLFILTLKVWGQELPYNNLFFWDKEKITENEVNSIHSYRFPYLKDSVLVDSVISTGIWQTEEKFDSLGRIVEKINHYKFSDRGDQSKRIEYNKAGKVETFTHYERDKLVRAEAYEWSEGKLDSWSISVPEENGFTNYKKEIIYSRKGSEIKIRLKKGRKVLSEDTVILIERPTFSARVVKSGKNRQTKDSVVYHVTSKDTLLKKDVYIDGIIKYNENKYFLSNGNMQIKSIEFVDGIFNSSYYRTYENGVIIRERQIHQIPNLNYTKKYYYSEAGLPIKKEIYRNTEKPVSVIYYTINYN